MAIVVALLLLLLWLMVLGWRRKQRRQSGLPVPAAVPESVGAELAATRAFYVATTLAGQPLERIVVAGLGYRAKAQLVVFERGISLAIPGQDAIFIPAADIRAVEKATWAIDRAVEPGGMVLVRWSLGAADSATDVDSYLRITDPTADTEFFATVRQLLGCSTQTGGHAQ